MSNLGDIEKKLIEDGEKLINEAGEALHLKKKKRMKKTGLVVGLILLLLVVVVAVGYFKYWLPFKSIINQSNRAQAYFLAAQDEIFKADFKRAGDYLDEAGKSMAKMEEGINSFGMVAEMGLFKKQHDALMAVAVAGQNLSNGLKLVTEISAVVLEPLEKKQNDKFSQVSSQEKRQILKSFYEAAPEINGAKAEIELAKIQLDELETDGVHPLLLGYIDLLKEKLDEIYLNLEKAAVMSRVLPTLLGYPDEKTYLFLLQNNDELRATGGFIGTVGVLKIKDATIASFETRNVYELDINAEGLIGVEAPAPITKYMGVEGWYLRDSNWSADFPTAARQAEHLFNLEAAFAGSPFVPTKFDGVIAITPDLIEDFLQLAGAVEIKGFVFNSENFVERLQYLVEIGYQDVDETFSTRKDIIGDLSQELFRRFENMEMKDWVDLVGILQSNLKEKQALVYLNDPIVQREVEEQNWGGQLKETALDFLMYVDSNLAALKTDQYMERDLSYVVYPNEKGELTAKVSMNYKNTGSFTWKSTRYRTYARVYVPLGSQLIKTEGSMENDRTSVAGETDVYEELGKTVFGTFIAIEPGDSGTLSFEYKLPNDIQKMIDDGYYSLLVQKQPGTAAVGLKLNLNFTANLSAASPAEDKQEWGDKKYILNTNLNEDRQIRLNF